MNNSVYVNDKVGKFYYVANDEDYGYFELTMLQDEGFHFVSYLDKEATSVWMRAGYFYWFSVLDLGINKMKKVLCVIPEHRRAF